MNEPSLNPISLSLGAAAVGALALAIDAFLVEPARVEIARRELPLHDLPPAWNGARLVLLSDLHYGNPRSESLFRWVVRTVNELEPDLVAIAGDFVLGRVKHVGPCVRHLAGLRSRAGVVAVLGDHDYCRRTGKVLPGIEEALGGAGVRLLRNTGLELDGGLRLAGVDPCTGKIRRADLDAALAALAGRPPHLLLSHTPDILPEAVGRGVRMVLCGHTHGGQVCAPFWGPIVTHTRVGRRYASGWSRLKETRMYTSRGIGSHYSLRFLCRPELTLFTLCAA